MFGRIGLPEVLLILAVLTIFIVLVRVYGRVMRKP